jgi:hypothetical protein
MPGIPAGAMVSLRCRGARAAGLYRSRARALDDFDGALLRLRTRREERELRALLGARWRGTDRGMRHRERRTVAEHCLAPPAVAGCACLACRLRVTAPSASLGARRGLYVPPPTATWDAAAVYGIRAGWANRRLLQASLRRAYILRHA